VAIATPPGRGGIGVVRLSGERAIDIVCGLIRLPVSSPETQHVTVGEFRDPNSDRVLDKVVVTIFRAPHSYTGEDIAEISCHGAPVILSYLVECCLNRGARTAEPGEFTLRAFLNSRIDLTQAEAVRDLIESRTLFQAQSAAQQMEGSVSARIKPHKKALVDLIARLEAGIDFGEDDVPVSGWAEIERSLSAVSRDLHQLASSYEYGRVVRDGLSLAIVGRPNVGKSSLFNRLLNEERAIVTATPGTTRDLVSESAAIGGIPLRLVDTAGLRETSDEAERIGVRKTMEAIADSDLRLLVFDASKDSTAEDAALLDRLRPLGALLVAFNKADLPHRMHEANLAETSNPESNVATAAVGRPVDVVWTSALTGEGVPELKSKLLDLAAPARAAGPDGALITNLRHQQLIRKSLGAISQALAATREHVHHEMLLLDLYDALHALDTITGATTVEDVLGVIFSSFCVGK
jgi:tRNA modification GTPase